MMLPTLFVVVLDVILFSIIFGNKHVLQPVRRKPR
jgi:hypothetical protein